ncbi:MAG: methylmalonyl Co-A mutase-associated GTPase MeaB, partial [Syntrophomonas sp.]
GTEQEIKRLFPFTGKAHVIGITGSQGAGKSTLTDEMTAAYRKKGQTVGVLAVDPTIPFTGGALLGDRIRMQRHAEDSGVFLRSLATRGAMGGLSQAVGNAIHVMDAMGKDKIIVETVGVGQQEVEIINHAHTVLVVLVPGMGDDVQAIKAGLMEIADIFVINKADRDGAAKLKKETSSMLQMGKWDDGWVPPIVEVENVANPLTFSGSVQALTDKIDEHYQFLQKSNLLTTRRHRKAAVEFKESLQAAILEPIIKELAQSGETEKMIQKIMTKELDPYSAAELVSEKYLYGQELKKAL